MVMAKSVKRKKKVDPTIAPPEIIDTSDDPVKDDPTIKHPEPLDIRRATEPRGKTRMKRGDIETIKTTRFGKKGNVDVIVRERLNFQPFKNRSLKFQSKALGKLQSMENAEEARITEAHIHEMEERNIEKDKKIADEVGENIEQKEKEIGGESSQKDKKQVSDLQKEGSPLDNMFKKTS